MSILTQTPERAAFDDLGYCIVPGLLGGSLLARCRAAIEALLTPETPDSVAHTWGTRRQTRTPQVFIPELDEIACLPQIQAAIAGMIDGPYRLDSTPIAVITYPGKVCGNIQDGNWGGHLDGLPDRPFAVMAHERAQLWLSFADIESRGGAFTVVPGSHKYVHNRVLNDPEWVAVRQKDNAYTREHNIPGMPWAPIEITCQAGDGFFYYRHAIHSASDNQKTQPRILALLNFSTLECNPATPESLAKGFSEAHLAAMSPAMRRVVGL